MNYLSSFITLPSLPALPTSYLPSLPSLPQNLQRRFLSYVLKRSLGHLVKDGALDPERIEAQVVAGHVEVKGVELDETAINELIPGTIPLRLESGSLGVLTADLGTSLTSSAHPTSAAPAPAHGAGSSSYSLNVALSHLHLNLVLDPARTTPSADASQYSDGAAPMVDLASSVLSVADEFVHRELDAQEGQDLLNSVRTLRRDQSSDPFVSPDANKDDDDDDDLWLPPGAMRPFVDKPRADAVGGGGAAAGGKPADAEGAKTLVMGFVEGLMARLKVNVKDVQVRVRLVSSGGDDDDDDDEDGVAAVELELRMSAVSYQDEPSSHLSTGTDPSVGGGKAKTLRFSSFKIVMLQPPPPISSPSTPMRRSSTPTLLQSSTLRSSATSHSSHSSSSSSDGDPHSTLMMSQAIADLRDSSLDDATQSLYESATEGAGSFLTPSPLHENRNPLDSQPGVLPNVASLPQSPPSEVWRTLLSLGDEDIVLRFSPAPATNSPATPVRPQAPSLQRSSSSSSSDMGSRPTSRIASAGLQGPAVSLHVPAVAVLVLPEQVATLTQVVGVALAGRPSPPPLSPTPHPEELRRSAAPHLLLHVRSIMLAAVYTDDEISPAMLESFWSRPRGGVLPAGHLVARVGRIEAHSNPHASVARPTASRAASRKAGLSRSPSSMGPGSPFKETPSSTTDLAFFVEDFSLFEHLSPAVVATSAGTTNPSPAVAPIIIMDPDLPNQYDFGSAGSFPDFESQDWRSGGRARKAGAVEKAWRVRSGRAKFAAAHADASPVDIGPALRASRSLAPGEGVSAHLLPLHLFLDLALVERLLPWLRSVSPPRPASPVPSQERMRDGAETPSRPGLGVLASLDAEYSDTPTARAAGPSSSPTTLHLPFLRLEIRCPAPASSKGIGDGSVMRSGILTLDVHEASIRLSPSVCINDGASQLRASAPPSPSVQLEWRQLGLFFLRVADTRARAFLAVGLSSAVSSHDASADGLPLLPRVQLFPAIETTSTRSSPAACSVSPQHVVCRLPSVQADVHKMTAEGLQYFVDDVNQWLNGAFGDGSRPCPKEDIRLIGSRFFGTKFSSVSSSSSDEGIGPAGGRSPVAPGASMITVDISDIDVTLRAPRTSAPSDPVRVMQLWAAETAVTFDTSVGVKKESTLRVAVGDLRFQDISHLEAPAKIVERTSHRGLESRPRPILSLQLVSTAELDLSRRDTDLEISIFNCTAYGSADLSWLSDLALFVKPPEGAFEDVEPSEVTRVSVSIDDTSLHLLAPTLAGALVVSLQDLLVSTELVNDAPGKTVGLSAGAIHLLLIDDIKAPAPEPKLKPAFPSSVTHWKTLGYAHILQITGLKTIVDVYDFDPRLKVDVVRLRVQVQACPDSLTTFAAMAADLAKVFSRSNVDDDSADRALSSESGSRDMTGSIEEQAFHRQPTLITDADLVEDDVPRNIDYLDDHHGDRTQAPEPLSAFETVSIDPPALAAQVIAETNGETVKLLDAAGILPVEDFIAASSSRVPESPVVAPSLKLRVRDCDVSIQLHDGFDWHSTQKAIELEVKSVRRRLEKIRQLLASGQTPDESVEQTSTTLFNSVYIGLPRYPTDSDATAYLAALGDDDLLNIDFADDTSQTTSFQSVKGRPGGSSPLPAKARSKRKRLTRSKHARIVFNLAQARVAFEAYPPGSTTASSVRVTIRDVEILDQIKTSTWKKFLTEMRVDAHGNTREADSHMVTIELVSVRPADDAAREECRLRAKILPLRLHVDQDALDFLKRFFSFKEAKVAGADAADSGGGSGKEVYLQHVEIFPIQLKLDYKPKRVDYKGLREGKTIELMNFFHFDGAEMTLRRITLSGVSGWPRLFDTLNVLWTPDVKANQLADIITSIAPIRSLVNVGSGVADLVLLPLEQYGRDRRIVRGVQRGATSFVKSTAIEAIKLGAGLATGTQVVLERAEYVLGGGRSNRFGSGLTGEALGGSRPAADDLHSSSDEEGAEHHSRYAKQPADVKEGVSTAYRSLSKNLNSAAETILAVPMEVYEKSSTDGPVRAVVRAIPIAVLKPMIGASEAVSKTLFGLRNTIDPSARRDLEDKYK